MSREWVDDAKPRPVDKRWVMRCDRYVDGRRCPTTSEPFVRQPPLGPFVELGWFVADCHGDVCPTCLAAGYVPTVKPHRLMATAGVTR